jgi:hypothetical protein
MLGAGALATLALAGCVPAPAVDTTAGTATLTLGGGSVPIGAVSGCVKDPLTETFSLETEGGLILTLSYGVGWSPELPANAVRWQDYSVTSGESTRVETDASSSGVVTGTLDGRDFTIEFDCALVSPGPNF